MISRYSLGIVATVLLAMVVVLWADEVKSEWPNPTCFERVVTGKNRKVQCIIRNVQQDGLSEFVFIKNRLEARHFRYLYFENCTLHIIPTAFFTSFKRLDHLEIANCKLRELNESSFQGAGNLSNLILVSNELRKLPADSFAGASNLNSIALFENKINEIDNDAFRNLLKLESLALSYNHISTIKESVFKGLPNLKELHLRFNEIETIDNGTFSNNTNLTGLYLSNNQLTNIDFVANLKRLKFLDLAGNLIETISDETFNDLPQLIRVILKDNRLTKFDMKAFSNAAPTLEKVDMSSNSLDEFVVDGSLPVFLNFKTLYLNSNNLTKIASDRLIEKCPALGELTLYDNNWSCLYLNTIIDPVRSVVKNFKNAPASSVAGIDCSE